MYIVKLILFPFIDMEMETIRTNLNITYLMSHKIIGPVEIKK